MALVFLGKMDTHAALRITQLMIAEIKVKQKCSGIIHFCVCVDKFDLQLQGKITTLFLDFQQV